MDNNSEWTILSLAPLIRRRKISPVELTAFCLDRISKLQPAINAFITVREDIALAQAKRAEMDISRGRYKGVLHGIPISVKDLFCTRGIRTTAGSKILRRFVPERNAEVIERLLASGCTFLGKTNMHEFAYGATNLNPHYGPVRNPWDTSRISGGSSGGSAASVVTAQAVASIGTDTGGSIRIPSAACGCVGLKPTYGRVSLEGVIPLSGTLDHAGPICRCVADAALMFDAMAQSNVRAPGTPGTTVSGLRRGVKSIRLGVPRQYFFDHLQPAVRRNVLAAVKTLKELGASLREVNLKGMEETARLAADITAGEALAFHEEWLNKRPEEYGKDVGARLEQSRGLTAAAYIQALQKRLAYTEEFERVLDAVDLILAPAIPVVAPGLDQEQVRTGRSRTDVRLALLSLTRPANLTGLPALSVPCGFSPDNLPIGLQLIGRRFGEATLLRAAWAYEQATPWHRQFP